MNFSCNQVEQSVLKCSAPDTTGFLCFYVDNILIASVKSDTVQQMKTLIKSKDKATDVGEAIQFLGITLIRKIPDQTLCMDQIAKVTDYVTQHGIEDNKVQDLPLFVPLTVKHDEEKVMHCQYEQISGQLQYLAGTTRRDICYAASVLARFNNHPTKEHWKAMRNTLKYLNGTKNLQLTYQGTS